MGPKATALMIGVSTRTPGSWLKPAGGGYIEPAERDHRPPPKVDGINFGEDGRSFREKLDDGSPSVRNGIWFGKGVVRLLWGGLVARPGGEATRTKTQKKKRANRKLKNRIRNLEKRYQRVVMNSREKYAAAKVLETMKKSQTKTCALVMGAGHEQGLVKSFLQQQPIYHCT